MKVLHLIAPIAFGGGESLLIHLLGEKSDKVNEEIALIYDSSIFREKLKEIQIPVHILRTKQIGQRSNRLSSLLDLSTNLLLIFKLKRIIVNRQIDIVHAHGFPASLMASLLKRKMPVGTLYTHHSYRNPPRFRLEKYIFTKVYNSFDFRTAVSNTSTNSLNKAFPEARQFQTVYNCIAHNFFNPVTSGNKYSNLSKRPERKFLQIARFSKGKNQKQVLASFLKLSRSERNNILIVFAGSGELETETKKFAFDHNLMQHVQFSGMVPHESIPDLISNCDYGLFPSNLEGFGIGAMECIAGGLPVLAQENELMREIIGPHGVLKKLDQLQFGFREIMQRSFSKKKMNQYSKMFAPEIVKHKYIKYYQTILSIQKRRHADTR